MGAPVKIWDFKEYDVVRCPLFCIALAAMHTVSYGATCCMVQWLVPGVWAVGGCSPGADHCQFVLWVLDACWVLCHGVQLGASSHSVLFCLCCEHSP
jgi:hypothetical protein